MRRGCVCLAALAVMAACLTVPATAEDKPKNLLVNGSFEEGPDAGDFLPLESGSTDIKGWTVTRAQVDYIGGHWKSAEGNRSLDLHGSPGLGGVKQAFATTKGRKYKVTFSMAANPNFQPEAGPVKFLCVRAAGKKEAFSFDAAGKTVGEMGWVTKTWEFTAVDDETTLEIHTLETEDMSCGPALDNVSVVEAK
jgi:choice-of-anchor C domain-containing protein